MDACDEALIALVFDRLQVMKAEYWRRVRNRVAAGEDISIARREEFERVRAEAYSLYAVAMAHIEAAPLPS